MDDLNRRDLIAAGATAAAAVGLAGCSPAGGTRQSAASTASAHGVTVKVSDIPVGGGKILQDGSYVVTQPSAGTFKAFNKTCTHQGCPVTKIVGAEIECTCHNSRFSIVDGSVTRPPATKPLAQATVTVDGDSLVITG